MTQATAPANLGWQTEEHQRLQRARREDRLLTTYAALIGILAGLLCLAARMALGH